MYISLGAHPDVSIIMPVLNGEESHLDETLDSIASQSFGNFEFIIIDDGSTDNTLELINDYASRDRRIKVIRNEKNIGIVESLNKGLRQSSSQIIARMDCGDIADRKRIEKQYDFLSGHSDVVLVSSQAHWIAPDGKKLFSTMYPADDLEIRKRLYVKDSILIHPAVMFRSIAGLYYRDIAATAEDYDYWLRLSLHGKLFIINEPLLTIRLNPDGTTYSKKMHQVKTADLIHRSFVKTLMNPHDESTWQIVELSGADLLQQNLFHRLTRYAFKYRQVSTLMYYFFKLLSGISIPLYMYRLIQMRLKRLTVSKDPLFQRYCAVYKE